MCSDLLGEHLALLGRALGAGGIVGARPLCQSVAAKATATSTMTAELATAILLDVLPSLNPRMRILWPESDPTSVSAP